MKTSSAKAKGRRCAQELKTQICETLGVDDLDIQVTPSGVTGPDLYISPHAKKKFPFVVECKNQEALAIWAALNQAASHQDAIRDMPLLVFTRNRADVYVALSLKNFLQIVKKAFGSKANAKDGRDGNHLGSGSEECEQTQD